MYTTRDATVAVLLSTYNGEDFLEDQLNSLLRQTYPHVEVVIRDDGSADHTGMILRQYAKSSNTRVVYGDNIGVVRSFFSLINLMPADTPYVAFCDQDDVWDDDKIERAVRCLAQYKPDEPAMYCGALRVVDEQLEYIRSSRTNVTPTFANALVQNIATGCTVLINNAALRLIANKSIEWSNIGMHDWWIYQVVAAFGKVKFDPDPAVNYRQHENNVIGSAFGVDLWKRRIERRLSGAPNILLRQTMEFLSVYGPEVPREKYILASEFLTQAGGNSVFRRAMYACKTPVYRQSHIDDIVMRVLIGIGQLR